MKITLPHRGRGRLSAAREAEFEDSLAEFCAAIREIRSRLDFDVSARGWCYLLEEHGLTKGNFDEAQELIKKCRKSGLLPLDIVAEDTARGFENLETIDDHGPEEEAGGIISMLRSAHLYYNPISFWEFQTHYLEMMVEKIDLKSLFNPICREFRVPVANARGWSDLNSRAAMMRRFAAHEAEGRQCVLLYCGDHDPAGLRISDFMRSNMGELSDAVGWCPDNLIIDRFGLNSDFIEQHGLTWIDNLETASGRRLDDPRHPDHGKAYVQDYLSEFGVRKVEANALVVRPEGGRDLCRRAILQYIDEDATDRWAIELTERRDVVQAEVELRLEQAR